MQGVQGVGRFAVLFTYSTSHLLAKDKVRFYYALKGRDGKSGVIKFLRADFLAKQVVIVPESADEEFKQFLRVWKLPFTRRKIQIIEEVQG